MRKLVVLLALVVGMLATMILPAGAITGDSRQDFEHPFVGVVAFYAYNTATGKDDKYIGRCSGSLLTPTLFLTAGHCTNDFYRQNTPTKWARVNFQQDALKQYASEAVHSSGLPVNCKKNDKLCATTINSSDPSKDKIFDYDYANPYPWQDFPDIRDVGLVILDKPIELPEYGALAAPGSLDDLATRRGQQEVTFTHSGYGAIDATKDYRIYSQERLMAQSKLTNLSNALTDGFSVQLTSNGSGRGGACNGDSGGPVFHGDYTSNTIVALAAWWLYGRDPCEGSIYYYRTDNADVHEWIERTVGKDEWEKIEIVDL